MAAQFGLIVQAAQAHALELAIQRARDGLAQRSLADAGSADEAQDRRLGVRIQLQHAQLFEDALLDILQTEVILIQHLPSPRDIELHPRWIFFHGSSST